MAGVRLHTRTYSQYSAGRKPTHYCTHVDEAQPSPHLPPSVIAALAKQGRQQLHLRAGNIGRVQRGTPWTYLMAAVSSVTPLPVAP